MFVKLTNAGNNTDLFVNSFKVSCIGTHNDGTTWVDVGDDDYRVRESAEDVMNKIEEEIFSSIQNLITEI